MSRMGPPNDVRPSRALLARWDRYREGMVVRAAFITRW
jgi:hypothetical protein